MKVSHLEADRAVGMHCSFDTAVGILRDIVVATPCWMATRAPGVQIKSLLHNMQWNISRKKFVQKLTTFITVKKAICTTSSEQLAKVRLLSGKWKTACQYGSYLHMAGPSQRYWSFETWNITMLD